MSDKDCIVSGRTNDYDGSGIKLHRTFVPEDSSAYAMYRGALEVILKQSNRGSFLGVGLIITDDKSSEVEAILEFDGEKYYLQSTDGIRLVTET